MLSRFTFTHNTGVRQTDGRTNRRTDIARQQRPRAYAWRYYYHTLAR